MNKTKFLTGALSLGVAGVSILGVSQFVGTSEEVPKVEDASESDKKSLNVVALESSNEKYSNQQMVMLEQTAKKYGLSSYEDVEEYAEFIFDERTGNIRNLVFDELGLANSLGITHSELNNLFADKLGYESYDEILEHNKFSDENGDPIDLHWTEMLSKETPLKHNEPLYGTRNIVKTIPATESHDGQE